MAVRLKVNGSTRSVPAEPDTPLLYVLRNDPGRARLVAARAAGFNLLQISAITKRRCK